MLSSNLALRCPTLQSSVSEWSIGDTIETDSAGAVNGRFDQLYGFHTAEEENPWWQVDLQSESHIEAIRLYNRICHPLIAMRASPLSILLSADGKNWITVHTSNPDASIGGSSGDPLVWRPPEAVKARYVRLQIMRRSMLHLVQVEVLGQRFGASETNRFRLENGADITEPDDQVKRRDLFAQFESLGNNCEFGIVQEACGCSGPSLFKNVGFHEAGQIIAAIDASLDGMFEADNYRFTTAENWPDFALDCHRFGFRFHTGVPATTGNKTAAFERRLMAFRFMKEKFLSDLRTGQKTFLYRNIEAFTAELSRRLFTSIRQHGPGWLLHVREDPRPQRCFAWVEPADQPGLIHGGMPHLSNSAPPRINYAAWEKIATGAIAIRQSARAIG